MDSQLGEQLQSHSCLYDLQDIVLDSTTFSPDTLGAHIGWGDHTCNYQ